MVLSSASSAVRSSGASMSSPRPGSSRMWGARPHFRAVSRWCANEGSPNVSAIASGGASATPLVPSPEREGTNAGAPSPAAPASRRSSSAVTRGTSPGTVRKTRAPRRAASACARATAAVWPRFSASMTGSAPRPRAIAATAGSRVTTQTRSSSAAASARSTSRNIARANWSRSASVRTLARRCLASLRSLIGTAATIITL